MTARILCTCALPFLLAFALAACGDGASARPDTPVDLPQDVGAADPWEAGPPPEDLPELPPADLPDVPPADLLDVPPTDLPDVPPTDLPDVPPADLPEPVDPSPSDLPDAADEGRPIDVTDLPDGGADVGPLPAWQDRPALVTRPDRKAAILARIDREPWSGTLDRIRLAAAADCIDDANAEWNSNVFEFNGVAAQANAVLAWLFDDEAAAARARDCFGHIRTDWETNTVWDMNIAMPNGEIPFAVAWDLLSGTSLFPAEEAMEARRRLVTVNEKFFDRYVGDDFHRWAALTVSQNNHPIRTVSAMGYVALAFPDEPRSREILDFAAGELAYLWGPTGRYIAEDGVVSEEPFYFGFGFPPALAFFLAMRNAWPADAPLYRNCINRNDVDPWAPVDCTDGEPFTWEDPLAPPGTNQHADRFWSAFDWSLDHRMPSGLRSTTGDGRMRVQNAGLLLASLSGRGRYAWDTRHNVDDDLTMTRGLNLTPQHLFDVTQAPVDVEPFWTSNAHLVSGHTTLRSGWGPDDLWIVFLGESGAARKTLHDHADGTSFALAAYGEYLLIDPGYYKPNDMDNAVTADAPAHNVILIDGLGAPTRGLLNDWGDADASLSAFSDGRAVDYAEVTQVYQQTSIRRSMVMVRDRYAVVADRLQTEAGAPREHAWRVNGRAGYESGGSYSIDADGATFARERAGIRVAIASTAGAPLVREPPFVAGAAPHVQMIATESGAEHHAVADAVISAAAPGFLAVLAPFKVGAAAGSRDAPLSLTRLATGAGAAAWLVTGTHGTDVIWLRTPEGPDTLVLPDSRELSTDAEFVVANLDDGLLMIRDGTQVTWDRTAHTAGQQAGGPAIADVAPDRCPDPRDADACFAAQRLPASDNIALATRIAHRQIARKRPDRLAFDWAPAVMMTAFCELHRVTGDPEVLAYVKAWMDHHLDTGYDMTSSDSASPVTVALYLSRVTPDQRYRDVVEHFRTYVRSEALRTPEGGLNHLGTLDIMGLTLWVDSLWMIGVPLARLGVEGPEAWALEEAGLQFRVFARLLQEEPGFLRHAANWALPQDPDIYWARGNGWVVAAGAEYLRLLRMAGRDDPEVHTALARLVAATRGYQDPDTGLWWTVLNRPDETYLETSAAGLFAFGMARAWRSGLLGDEVLPSIAQAMAGVRSRVVEGTDGPVVTGTSGPTTAGTFSQYAKIAQADDIPYGIGAVILSLIETSGLPAP